MRASERQLRVGLIAPAFDKGGLESIVFALYRHLKQNGHQATVFVEGGEIGYFSERLAPSDLVILRKRQEQFFAEVLARRINVLHYHYSTFMLQEMKSLNLGVLYTLHNIYTWLDDAEFRARSEAIDSSDTIVAVSSYARDYYKNRSNTDHRNIVVVPNGVKVERLRGATPIDREQLGLPECDYVFAQFSSFHRVKHHMALIRAAEKLAARKKWRFHVAFFGNVGDRKYYDEIRLAVMASSARNQISLPGYLKEEEVGGALRGAVDCVMMTTLQEGCGNAALEAAAVNRPIIMTDTGIARDLETCGVDIDVIPAACEARQLNYREIERLSRDANPPNLPYIVAAMANRLQGATNSKSTRGEFPFSMARMLGDYENLYAAAVHIA